MAGIEKVCEFSGDYDGWLMYGYKHNRIQVNPEYRKLFKGLGFKFYRFLPDWDMCNWKGKPMTDYCLYVPDLKGQVNGFYYNWTYNQLGIVRRKLQKLMGVSELNEIRIPLTMRESYDYSRKQGLQLDEFMLECETYTNEQWLKITGENECWEI